MTNLQTDLLLVVEKLREEQYPELPADLVERILSAEQDYLDAPGEALRRVRDALYAYLQEGTDK